MMSHIDPHKGAKGPCLRSQRNKPREVSYYNQDKVCAYCYVLLDCGECIIVFLLQITSVLAKQADPGAAKSSNEAW